MRRTLVFFLTLSMVASLSFSSDDWTGLWRVKRILGDDLDGVLHLYFSSAGEERLTIYGDLYRPLTIRQLKITEGSLDVLYSQSIKHPLPVQLKVERKDGRLEGEWTFAHFQMTTPLTGSVVGARLHRADEWEPWEPVHANREGRIIDILGFLFKNAPTSSFEKFLSYWDGIEPRYYFLLEDWLYGRGPGDSNPRKERLRAAFETLKRSRDSKRLIVDFPKLAEASVRESEEVLGWPSKVYFVSSFASSPVLQANRWSRIPEPGEQEACNCEVLNLSERYVSVNPALFATRGEGGTVQLRRELIRASLWEDGQVSREVDLLRRGLALRLALRAEGKAVPVVAGDTLKEMVERLRSPVAPKPLAIHEPPVEGSDADSHLEDTVGSQFVASLLESRSVTEVASMEPAQVGAEWKRYVRLITQPEGN